MTHKPRSARHRFNTRLAHVNQVIAPKWVMPLKHTLTLPFPNQLFLVALRTVGADTAGAGHIFRVCRMDIWINSRIVLDDQIATLLEENRRLKDEVVELLLERETLNSMRKRPSSANA